MAEKYGDERRTRIAGEVSAKISAKKTWWPTSRCWSPSPRAATSSAWLPMLYRAQHRGGRGVTGQERARGRRGGADDRRAHPGQPAVLLRPRQGLLDESPPDPRSQPHRPRHAGDQRAGAGRQRTHHRGGGCARFRPGALLHHGHPHRAGQTRVAERVCQRAPLRADRHHPGERRRAGLGAADHRARTTSCWSPPTGGRCASRKKKCAPWAARPPASPASRLQAERPAGLDGSGRAGGSLLVVTETGLRQADPRWRNTRSRAAPPAVWSPSTRKALDKIGSIAAARVVQPTDEVTFISPAARPCA